ncbi:unnamed protein product [Cylindrotheca closterium]|uniref:CRAL-TRIO domain-containing protein n=1 Tax=Cylindrotheca closterium TaxID=2856 RepID=A0AAD2CRM1_9STRA|nr:unnamed protein product [Cylindrotheca closterium]
MNQLCGLELESTIDDYLSEAERIALKEFTEVYEGTCPEAISPASKVSPQFGMLDEHHHLHSEDGWRKLDQVTLYRFLCADRVSPTGKFQQAKSLDRLQRALRHRTVSKADAILDWWMDRLEQQGHHVKAGSGEPRKPNRMLRKLSSSSLYSSSSIATGSFRIEEGADTSLLEDVEFVPHHQIRHPGFSAIDLEKYRRLRIREFSGRCHKGQPVLFERLGAFLGSGNHVHFSHEEWMQLYIWDLERHFIEMREAAKANGKPVHKYIFCGDGQGMVEAIMNRSIWKVVPLLKAYKAVEDFYPEIADTIILFNVPKIATFFYRMVRGFLDPVTAEKINLYSTSDYKEVFSKIMPLDAVPQEYGGTSKKQYPKMASS